MRTLTRYLMVVMLLFAIGFGVFTILPTPLAAITSAGAALKVGDIASADRLAAALAALGCWAVLGWAVLTSTTTAAVAIGGGLGRVADSITAKLAPRIVRHTIATILGVTLLTGLAATGPAHAHANATPDPPPGSTYSLNLDWPTNGAAPAALPADTRQSGSPGQGATEQIDGDLKREATYEQAPPPQTAPDERDGVTVAPGDSLWSITQRTLGPTATESQVATEWPHWWQANRDVIGENPDVIHPGQELRAPSHDEKPLEEQK